LGYNIRLIEVREGPKNKDTMSGHCNKLNFRGDKLGYNSNWSMKPNVIMLAATVHVEQQLKTEKEASLMPLFKNHLRNLFKLWDWSLEIGLWGEKYF
jgi:hypothetical protein